MNIAETIKVINQMQADGVIGSYAVGGAVGATFYLEPVATFDVDIFVHFEPDPSQAIITLKPIFDYLAARGCTQEREYVNIAGTPVQFLVAGTSLVEEAIKQAVPHDLDDTPVRVFTAEHLCAIALEVGRAKDKTRVVQFIEEGAIDQVKFQAVVTRHGLADRWQKFERQFFTDQP
jgi:hypothetical protein